MDATNQEPTKRCPYCGEQILAVAIKCKHCTSMLAAAPAMQGQPVASSAGSPSQPTSPPAGPRVGDAVGQAIAGVLTAPATNWKTALSVAIGTLPFSIILMIFGSEQDVGARSVIVGVLTSAAFCALLGGVTGIVLRVAYPHLVRSNKVATGASGLGAAYALVLFFVHQGALETHIRYGSFPTLLALAMVALGAANGVRQGIRSLALPAAAVRPPQVSSSAQEAPAQVGAPVEAPPMLSSPARPATAAASQNPEAGSDTSRNAAEPAVPGQKRGGADKVARWAKLIVLVVGGAVVVGAIAFAVYETKETQRRTQEARERDLAEARRRQQQEASESGATGTVAKHRENGSGSGSPASASNCNPTVSSEEKSRIEHDCTTIQMNWADQQTRANCDERQNNYPRCRAVYERDSISVGLECRDKMMSTKCVTWR